MSSWIEHYLRAEYEDGARGPDRYDCWGLVRDARHRLFGGSLLPSWGEVRNDQLQAFTAAYQIERARGGFRVCDPQPGAIAAVFRGDLVYHVALVVEADSRLFALEMRPKYGVTLTPISEFIRRCRRVEFYCDR